MQKGIEKGIEQGIEKGQEEGLQKGIEIGTQRGIEKRRQESVRKLIVKDKFSLEEIADLFDLSLEEVLRIQNQS